ncbi:MAG: ribosome biogenesis GTPase Der [Solitalea-like symbiont of Acarus siro]
MKNTVAIVGRPNVGKSTLFNRLTSSQNAIVYNQPGITRDRQYGISDWQGKEFNIIDTGGYQPANDDIFIASIARQVEVAIKEANVIIFLVDVYTGITDTDLIISRILRKSNKKVFVVANKVDNANQINQSSEFYKLGLSNEIFEISATSGSGTGDLLDAIVQDFDTSDQEAELEIDSEINDSDPEPEDLQIHYPPKIAIVGRPNVGKSTLLNTFISDERVMVSDIAGTTRDTIEVPFTKFGYDIILLDTAGLRRKTKVHEDIEFYSTLRSIRAIQKADVCFLVIDSIEGLKAQDLKIFSLIYKHNKGLAIVVNKWDLAIEYNLSKNQMKQEILDKIAPFTDVPIIFVSALKKEKLLKALDTVIDISKNKVRRIPTSKLNEIMLDIIECFPPPQIRGASIKIKYVTQIKGAIPTFLFFANKPKHIKENYKRFLENKLREHFNFHGAPIRLYFREK